MDLAFERFEEINTLPDIIQKHRAWLKAYEGKHYSKALEEKHFMKWQTEPKEYRDSSFDTNINLIKELPNRLRIEFDGDTQEEKARISQDFEAIKQKVKGLGFGFIISTHKGKCPYLWLEFTRALTDNEKKRFLQWITPKGSRIDTNFASSEKVFQVMYAVHWRHSYQRELPIEYVKGQKVDFDSLNIPFKIEGTKKLKRTQGFNYETFLKEDLSVNYNDKPLQFWKYKDFENLKEDKHFIVKNVIYPKTLTMLYSPPGEFKSLLALNMALAIANGKEWLGFKTERQSVLYCDKENNDQILKGRITGLHSGLRLRRKNYPLFVLRRQGDLLNPSFIKQLKQAVVDNKIKVIFFDTLHRFADYDENAADDLNNLYTNVLQPFIEHLGCSVIFLHHSNKDGGYRGSGDFLGMVDTSYQVLRDKANGKKLNSFRLINEKCRAGEIELVKGEIDFAEDKSYIKLIRLNEEQEETKEIDKLKAVTEKIKEFTPSDRYAKRKDIITAFDMAKVEYTLPTFKRAIKWLVDKNYLDSDDKGGYRRLIA